MKKILILLVVVMITANLSGCCCRRLCPWLDRGAYCGSPSGIFSPLAATTPAVMPSYQPYPYATPLAATSPACCPTAVPCSSWDPCQGQVNYAYPSAMPTGYAPNACCPTAAVEPGCAFDPYMTGMPMMTSGCDTCGTGYSGAIMGQPSPEVVLPNPTN